MATYPVEFDTPHKGNEWLQYYQPHNVFHPGWDLNKGKGNADLGNPVVCPISGVVTYVSPFATRRNNANGGLGLFIVIYHASIDRYTRYAHLSDAVVEKDTRVEEGQFIGRVGNTGTSSAHLHWEVWKPALFSIQKNHFRPFAFYPSGKSKKWVETYYEDGLALIQQLNMSPHYAQKQSDRLVALKWWSEGKDLDGPMTRGEFAVVADHLIDYINDVKTKLNKLQNELRLLKIDS